MLLSNTFVKYPANILFSQKHYISNCRYYDFAVFLLQFLLRAISRIIFVSSNTLIIYVFRLNIGILNLHCYLKEIQPIF
jgi:hypothetical protein